MQAPEVAEDVGDKTVWLVLMLYRRLRAAEDNLESHLPIEAMDNSENSELVL